MNIKAKDLSITICTTDENKKDKDIELDQNNFIWDSNYDFHWYQVKIRRTVSN
jgi:hypothetical protein